MIDKVLFSSDKMDWETPDDFFDEQHERHGFTLDVCASTDNTKCDKFIDAETNALVVDWGKNVCWMNPPYGRALKTWMAKALSESEKGATVVCLVPSRTDTKWWHDYAMKGDITFIKGRLKFVGAKSCAPFPSAVVVFRPPSLLSKVFGL